MATRQSLQSFGQAFSRGIEPILAALIAKQQEDEFKRALFQSSAPVQAGPVSSGMVSPGMPNVQAFDQEIPVQPRQGMQTISEPDPMAVMAQVIRQMPGNPYAQRALQTEAALAPKFQIVPQGSMTGRVDMRGKFTPEGINPKPVAEQPGSPRWVLRGGQPVFDIPKAGDAPYEKPSNATEPNLQGTKYVDQNNTEWRIFFNPKTGEEMRRVKVGPAAQSTLQSGKNSQYAAMVDLLNNIKAGKKDDYLGGVFSGGGGLLGGVRETTGAIDDQEAQFRANVSSLANQLLYLRSGAQINEQEFERLMKEMPSVTLAPNVFDSRLQAFEKQLESMLRAKNIDPASVGLSAQPQQNTQPTDDPLGIF